MEVNEKCDVYSFGVLTLEIIMGKHPGDLISFLSSSSSSSATSSAAHNILMKDILDLRLEPPENEVLLKVVSIVKLALHAWQPIQNLGQPCRRYPESYLLEVHLYRQSCLTRLPWVYCLTMVDVVIM